MNKLVDFFQEDNYLETSIILLLLLCPLTTNSCRLSSVAYDLPNHEVSAQVFVSSFRVGLKCPQKVMGYHTAFKTLVPVGLSLCYMANSY